MLNLISPHLPLDYVAYTGPIPSLDYFPFKTRALALVKKWRRPKAAATSAALSDIFLRVIGLRPQFPPEVLMYVFKSYVGDASLDNDLKICEKAGLSSRLCTRFEGLERRHNEPIIPRLIILGQYSIHVE